MRAEIESWLSNLRQVEKILFLLLVFFLPSQLGKHFWPDYSYVAGIRVDYLSPTLYFTDILVICVLIVWLMRVFDEKVRKFQIKDKFLNFKKNHQVFIFLTLAIILFAHLRFSVNPQVVLLGTVRVAEVFLLAYYVAKNVDYYRFSNILIALSLGVMLESLLAIFQVVNNGSLNGIMYFLGERRIVPSTPGAANASINGNLVFRPYGTFSHPNTLAGFLVVSSILILAGFKNVLGLSRKVFFACALAFAAVGTFFSLSRVATGAWILSFIFLASSLRPKAQVVKLGIFFFAMLAAVGIGALAFFPITERFLSVSLVDESLTLRLKGAETSLLMFKESPIVGVGLNNFIPNAPLFDRSSRDTFYLQPVHNIFLLILAETGLLGFCLTLYFLALVLKRVRTGGYLPTTFGAIVLFSVLLLGFFDHYLLTQQQGRLLLGLVFGIIFAQSKSSPKRLKLVR